MSVTAPPRPPRQSDPVDREELEALVEALIEEARQRQRRRRRFCWALAAVIALTAVVVFAVFERAAQSRTASPASAAHSGPAAAPPPSRIAFVAGVQKPSPTGWFFQTELYVINGDGSGMRRLVRHASGLGPVPHAGGGPVWSPDGLKLAFAKRLGPAIGQCGVCHTEIFVMNADGTGQRNLTGKLGGEAPTWSPDGQTIAFSSTRDNSSIPNLYVMNADGSGQRRVTQDTAGAWGSSWAPDGRRLAFERGGVGNNSNIYVVDVDGSGLQQLTRDPGRPDGFPAWSPDGRTIAFRSYRDERPLGGRRWQKVMYVMNTDGSGQRKLARLSNRGEEHSFSWSPDGRRIAFVSDRDGNDEVYVINVDGTGLRNLTRNPGRDAFPKWSPDGRTIGFVRNRGGNPERLEYAGALGDIYVMNADGSGQRNLTRGLHQQALGIAWSPAQKK